MRGRLFSSFYIYSVSVEVIIAREGAEAGDGHLLPAAIRTWLKGSRDRGVARRRTKTCSDHHLVPFPPAD
ncbi:hypothetical protein EG68_11804 [Paragonimus skrjabini miyazakii]|uniref:Uncharacterized protein n=1 Tax=Paragonimus skrjabini miyazakii TaxID=59628 RepID=A0A8S9YDE1_9TREM|nr:hypothetical protein EG68_11804 [Paragonimus skrjabini miyazakii]